MVQYGLNVATERGVKYDGYKKGMLTVIEHLKTAFPETSILLVSVGDREYKNENGDLRTMPESRILSVINSPLRLIAISLFGICMRQWEVKEALSI